MTYARLYKGVSGYVVKDKATAVNLINFQK